jgi:hypothetical protein
VRRQNSSRTVTVSIFTPINPALVEPVGAVEDGIEVRYDPDLVPPVRYPGDHQGVEGFIRDADAERRWQELLGSAEVLFGLPGDSPAGLAAAVPSNPRLRSVQGTAAGAGEQVKASGLSGRLAGRLARDAAIAAQIAANYRRMIDVYAAAGTPPEPPARVGAARR